MIVMHSDNEEYPELPAKWDTLQFRASWSEELTFREIQKVLYIYSFWEKRLSDAVLEQVEIPKLMNTATDLFPNPIALFDPSFARIGHGGRIPENIEDPIWETVLGKKFASVKIFRMISDSIILRGGRHLHLCAFRTFQFRAITEY